jgi:hypothetical protein
LARTPDQLNHVIVPDQGFSESRPFSPPGSFGSKKTPERVPDRQKHAETLLNEYAQALAEAEPAMHQRAAVGVENGYYLEVESRPDVLLLTDKLERGRKHKTRLLSVRQEGATTRATVFVPEESKDLFDKLIHAYETKQEPLAKQPVPKGWTLIEGIGRLRNATLRDLWTGNPEDFPTEGTVFGWEVWLSRGTEERFRAFANENAIQVSATMLVFPEELALHTVATPEQMNVLVNGTVSVTRLQRASLTSAFLEYAGPEQQVEFTQQILARMRPAQNPANYICILDTGVRREHPLLVPILFAVDCHAYRPEWGTDDHHEHGTLMGGLASFGDLIPILNANDAIEIPFHLESVKIYPPIGDNPHELLGAITQGGIARAELAFPERKRVFCLASSTPDDSPHRGKPSSWAAELDQLCAGLNQEHPLQRLICVSAGNLWLNPYHRDKYILENDLAEVESPAQAWNALTVGAYTEKVEINGNGREGWIPLAPRGDLSPTSRTSTLNWEFQWPSKPDVVLEGGNLGIDPADNHALGVDSLALLSTSKHFPQQYFQTVRETSAATALASRICAWVQSQYPALWPETIRALIVNSAAWTPAMLARLPAMATKAELREFLGRYGYGVPDGERALWSKRNALTLVSEDSIQPFVRSGTQAKLHQMRTFSLPWPREALQALEAENVSMKVTLSYFIEPNPAETARNRNSRYASHGLRFAVKMADEDDDHFQKRINKLAREEGEKVKAPADDGWLLGSQLRSKGSLHHDIWTGPASDLARRGSIAVFPVSGWWKDRPQLEKVEKVARFSLVVSIQTPRIETDIYTPVSNLIPIPIQ